MSDSVPDAGISIEQAVEAVLLTSDKPVKPAQVADALTEALGRPVDSDDVRAAVTSLNDSYRSTGRSFTIEIVAAGLRLMARPELSGVLASFHGHRVSNKLSRAALETLAIIAYRQPVTRAEIESIRGVACGEVLRSLMDRRLVTIAGRAEELGRPMLYGTTRDFLSQFGLASIKDLPEMADSQAAGAVRPKPKPVGMDDETADEPLREAETQPSLETIEP